MRRAAALWLLAAAARANTRTAAKKAAKTFREDRDST
jgi:hypothetical protein